MEGKDNLNHFTQTCIELQQVEDKGINLSLQFVMVVWLTQWQSDFQSHEVFIVDFMVENVCFELKFSDSWPDL